MRELKLLRLMENFVQNNKVLESNNGELKVVRRPNVGSKANPFEYYPCLHCHETFNQKELYKACGKMPVWRRQERNPSKKAITTWQ
jgi:hypothetical protein